MSLKAIYEDRFGYFPQRIVVYFTALPALQHIAVCATMEAALQEQIMNEEGKSPTTHLGELLTDLREKAGLTMFELARRSGMNRSTLMRLEAGHRKQPETGTLNQLARALGVEPEILYDAVWEERDAPLPTASIYFRSKYHLDSEQIAKMEASLKRITTASKTKTTKPKSTNKTGRNVKPTERRSP